MTRDQELSEKLVTTQKLMERALAREDLDGILSNAKDCVKVVIEQRDRAWDEERKLKARVKELEGELEKTRQVPTGEFRRNIG